MRCGSGLLLAAVPEVAPAAAVAVGAEVALAALSGSYGSGVVGGPLRLGEEGRLRTDHGSRCDGFPIILFHVALLLSYLAIYFLPFTM